MCKQTNQATTISKAVEAKQIASGGILHASIILPSKSSTCVSRGTSGASTPSKSDRLLTDALKQALSLVDVRVLDHFIVAGTETLSFAERGML